MPVDLQEMRRLAQSYERDGLTRTSGVIGKAANEIARLRSALTNIADQDPVEMALDPEWASRTARAALGRMAEGG